MREWLPAMAEALSHEASAISRTGRVREIYVRDGVPRDMASSQKPGVTAVWFQTEYEGPLPGDAGGQLRVGNRSFQASLIDHEPGRILISVEHPRDALPSLASATFQIDPTELIIRLRNRLLEAKGNPSIKWDLLGQVSGAVDAKVGEASDSACVLGGLDTDQARAVRRAMGSSVLFLQGPPGTGKTHTISYIVASALRQRQRILVTSHTHVAVDQALLALHRNHGGSSYLVRSKVARLGEPRLEGIPEHYLASKVEFSPDGHRELIQRAGAVFATLSKTYMDEALWNSTFDIVLIDEISMANAALAFAGLSRSTGRVVLVGDPHQLPPIVQARSPEARDWLGTDLFEKCHAVDRTCFDRLTVQRRMRPPIADIARRLRYQRRGELVDSPETSTRDAISIRESPFGMAPVVRVQVDLPVGSVLPGEGGSYWNLSSALASVDWLRQLALQLPQPESLDKRPLGLIVPYTSQRRLILRLVQAAEILDWVLPGTVHTFQGNEADIVVFDPVLTTPAANKRITSERDFGETSRDLNVAVTRAREQFAIVTKGAWLRNQPGGSALGVLAKAAASGEERSWGPADGGPGWDVHLALKSAVRLADFPARDFVFVAGDSTMLGSLSERIRAWADAGRRIVVAGHGLEPTPGVVVVPFERDPQPMVVTDRMVLGTIDGSTWIAVQDRGTSDVVSRLMRIPALYERFGEGSPDCDRCGGAIHVEQSDVGQVKYAFACRRGHRVEVPQGGWRRKQGAAPASRPAQPPGRAKAPPRGQGPPPKPQGVPYSSESCSCGHVAGVHASLRTCLIPRCQCGGWERPRS